MPNNPPCATIPRASPGRASYSRSPSSEQDTLTAATRGERARAACEITTTRLGPRHEHAAGIRLSRKRESATAGSSCVRHDVPSFSTLCFVLPNTRTQRQERRGAPSNYMRAEHATTRLHLAHPYRSLATANASARNVRIVRRYSALREPNARCRRIRWDVWRASEIGAREI